MSSSCDAMEDSETQDGLLSELGVTAVPVAEVEGDLLSKVRSHGMQPKFH